jgi:DNA-binding transcriptional ArsR family regulator
MKKEKVLLDPQAREGRARRVLASEDPSAFFPAATGVGHRILHFLAKGPSYPSLISRELRVHHQTAYYHMRKLEKAGLVKRVGSRVIKGGRAELYALASDGYAVEFNVPGEKFSAPPSVGRSAVLGRFMQEFVSSGTFNGWIVVGSPEPHGPNRTQGRDAHYAIQLGFALGQFVNLPKPFPVKLDVDLKSERLEGSNLVLVGGPRTNIISAELNPHLPVRFSEESFWGSIVDERGRRYLSDLDAIVAKVRNPWDPSKVCIIVAGLTGAGTKAAVIGLTSLADELLRDYSGGAYAVVLKGVDMDGDGKVDGAELLHARQEL